MLLSNHVGGVNLTKYWDVVWLGSRWLAHLTGKSTNQLIDFWRHVPTIVLLRQVNRVESGHWGRILV